MGKNLFVSTWLIIGVSSFFVYAYEITSNLSIKIKSMCNIKSTQHSVE